MNYLGTAMGVITTSSTLRHANWEFFTFLTPILWFTLGLFFAIASIFIILFIIKWAVFTLLAKIAVGHIGGVKNLGAYKLDGNNKSYNAKLF